MNDQNLNRKYNRLFILIRNLTSKIEPEKAQEAIIDAAIDITGATSGTLILINREKKVLDIKVQRGFSGYIRKISLRIGEGITGRVAKTGKPILAADVREIPYYVKIKRNIRSELAVPLILDRKVIGIINVDSSAVGAFTREDLKLLTILASQSSRVIQNTEQYDTIQKKAYEFQTLNEVNKLITESLELDRVLNLIVQKAAELMNTKICSLMMVREDELILKSVHGSTHAYIHKPSLKIKKCLIGRVIKTGKSLKVKDVLKEKKYNYPDVAKKEGIRSLLSVPLRVQDRIIGCLNTYKNVPYEFSAEEVRLLTSFANQSAIALENARLYQDVLQMESELRRLEKLTTAGEIAVGIAHEIRNPLTIVNMLLQEPQKLNRKDIDVVHKELKRINNIISYFLSFYKLKETELKDDLHLHEIINQTLLLVSTPIGRKKVRLKKSFSREYLHIRGDAGQLSQVLLNIVLNAIDSMDGGGVLSIRTGISRKKNMVKITVSDTGGGVPEYLKNKLFQPFITTKSKGMGLGLSICKRIIEAHNGYIKFSSKPGGTTFYIYLEKGISHDEKNITHR